MTSRDIKGAVRQYGRPS